MRFYCISDNVDTQIGLRLVGIEGEVVHKRREFLELLETKLKDDSIGTMTEGGVPKIFTPFFSKSAARFNGVWPPNWAITPAGCSFL